MSIGSLGVGVSIVCCLLFNFASSSFSNDGSSLAGAASFGRSLTFFNFISPGPGIMGPVTVGGALTEGGRCTCGELVLPVGGGGGGAEIGGPPTGGGGTEGGGGGAAMGGGAL